MKSITVIMTVFNTPKDVFEEALDCIVAQNFDDFQLICVDDASTNLETVEVLNKYESKYEFIKVIRLEKNLGCGGARNVGLGVAKGKYVIFLDSDDVFAEEYLSKLYEEAEKNQADVCVCGFSAFCEEKSHRRLLNRLELNCEYNVIKKQDDLLEIVTTSACNKLCRLDYLRKYNIVFQTLPTDDDVYYAAMVMLCTNKIVFVNSADLFLYRLNTEFQMSANMNPVDLFEAISRARKDLEMWIENNEFINRVLTVCMLTTGVMEMQNCKVLENNKLFYQKCKNYMNKNYEKLESKRANKIQEYWLKKSYEDMWINLIGNYEAQLDQNAAELIQALNCTRDIYLWGRGKRGMAFVKFAFQKHISIKGICDKYNKDCSTTDEYGNLVISTDEMLKKSGLIVAANRSVYNYVLKLSNDLGLDIIIICLEDYCLL